MVSKGRERRTASIRHNRGGGGDTIIRHRLATIKIVPCAGAERRSAAVTGEHVGGWVEGETKPIVLIPKLELGNEEVHFYAINLAMKYAAVAARPPTVSV